MTSLFLFSACIVASVKTMTSLFLFSACIVATVAASVPPHWPLPEMSADLSSQEEECLSREQVLWPADGRCYSLLARGPCQADEWLGLDTSDSVVCRRRSSPCDRPDLCEVELPELPEVDGGGAGGCRCRVSLAAAQEGLCDRGEQLLVSPYGKGVCGCVASPPHVRYPGDENCYPYHSRGPCQQGFVLEYSEARFEPTCQPNLCGEGLVFWKEDAKCHALGSQGPCDEVEVLDIDPDTLEVGCRINEKITRLYDIIPHNQLPRYGASDGVKLDKSSKCHRDSRGKCRKTFRNKRNPRTTQRTTKPSKMKRRRNARQYILWLRQFRRR